ncbi:MAG: hypothetical protein KDA61_12305, partial [Planctomycetales bacterium]|nr:hypothetical protein [Planctomycetales bacterium]
MKRYQYTVRLTADGEPGTGLGGENVNAFAPRNAEGEFVLHGSHLKGLMRVQFGEMARSLGWDPSWESALFGIPGQTDEDDETFSLGQARSEVKCGRAISRTRLASNGTAETGTLRTVEAVPVETVFRGEIRSQIACDEPLEIALKLAVTSLDAIGSGRNRGAGQCVVSIDDFNESPGELACEFDRVAKAPYVRPRVSATPSPVVFDGGWTALDLTFVAADPICCPETADKTNVLRSGFAIPASAVQGVVLHRLNRINPTLADKTFASDCFRSWPLLPVGPRGQDAYCDPVRVGLTHR